MKAGRSAGAVPAGILLAGSGSNAAEELIGEVLAGGIEHAADLRDLASGEFSGLHVLCPSDEAELLCLTEALGRCGPPSAPAVAFAGFRSGIPPAAAPAFLGMCGFSARVIARLAGWRSLLSRGTDSLQPLKWLVTGALMPFFVHNMNNLLTAVMGNTELAVMCLERGGRADMKLSSAMKGIEELRDFIERMALPLPKREGARIWDPSRLEDMASFAGLFCGRSVEFSVEKDEALQAPLPAEGYLVDTVLALAEASAAIMINGCGRLRLGSRLEEMFAELTVKWESAPGASGLCEDPSSSAAELLAAAVEAASASGLRTTLHGPNPEEDGAFSVFLPAGAVGKETPCGRD